jgi:hypothetical protein
VKHSEKAIRMEARIGSISTYRSKGNSKARTSFAARMETIAYAQAAQK